MAKTTTTTRTLDIVDLIRKRRSFPLLNVPPMRVKVTIQVTTTALLITPAAAPDAKMKRLEDVARYKLLEYEKIITEECAKFNGKIDRLGGKPDQAKQMASEVNASVKNALLSAEGAASKAVEDALKAEAQGDKLLAQARVLTAVKFTFIGISLATSAARLAGSHGADATAYVSIAKQLATLAGEIKQQLKDEPKLRADLVKAVDEYMKLRGTIVMQAANRQGLRGTLPGFPKVIEFIASAVAKSGKEVAKGRTAGQIAKEVGDFVVKGISAKFNDLEKARQKYRDHTTKMRHQVDAVSTQADKLSAAMKSATTLKDGVRIGAECMQMKRHVTGLGKSLDEAKGFLEGAEATMKGFGLTCDDRTILDKFKALDKGTIAGEAAGLVSKIDAVYGLLTAIAAVA